MQTKPIFVPHQQLFLWGVAFFPTKGSFPLRQTTVLWETALGYQRETISNPCLTQTLTASITFSRSTHGRAAPQTTCVITVWWRFTHAEGNLNTLPPASSPLSPCSSGCGSCLAAVCCLCPSGLPDHLSTPQHWALLTRSCCWGSKAWTTNGDLKKTFLRKATRCYHPLPGTKAEKCHSVLGILRTKLPHASLEPQMLVLEQSFCTYTKIDAQGLPPHPPELCGGL